MNFHCGHYVSEVNGGKIAIENMRPICSGCNSSMGPMNMNDFIIKFSLKVSVMLNVKEEIVKLIDCKDGDDEKMINVQFAGDNGKIMYKCDKCGKNFKRKEQYERHIIRQYPCDLDLTICKYCTKTFSSNSSCYRHKKKCQNNFSKEIKLKVINSVICKNNNSVISHEVYVKLLTNTIINKPTLPKTSSALKEVTNMLSNLDDSKLNKLKDILLKL